AANPNPAAVTLIATLAKVLARSKRQMPATARIKPLASNFLSLRRSGSMATRARPTINPPQKNMGARAHRSLESEFIRFVSEATQPATEFSDPTYRKNNAARLKVLRELMRPR